MIGKRLLALLCAFTAGSGFMAAVVALDIGNRPMALFDFLARCFWAGVAILSTEP